MKLISYIRPPYGGSYYWRDPVTGVEVRGTHFEMLINSAYAERKANGAPIGLDFEREIEQEICRTYPNECDNVPAGQRQKTHWTMGEIVRGTLTFAKHKLTGSSLVDQQTANQRAQICSTCPRSVFFSKPCAGLCAELVNVLSGTGDKRTPYDYDLRACGICGCWTRVAVWFPLETQCIGVTDELKKQFAAVNNCWKQCT